MRYLITGGSGYIGSRLVDLLGRRDDTEKMVICDVASPKGYRPKTEYERIDVRDRQAVRSVLERVRPDVLVHLAFILNPSHDERFAYDVDVNGTHNVLEAAEHAGTRQLLVTTSGVAYGAFPDNPVPLTEDDPVRGVAGFSYARDKTESDRLCQLWALEHPDRTMTIVRPCIVFGPNVDNYISRSWRTSAFMPILDGVEEEFQLVHEDDVISAIVGLLDERSGGAFNVGGDGRMTWKESAEMVGLKTRVMSMRAMRRIYGAAWTLHAPRVESPPGNLSFIRYPWIVSNEKLKNEIDWQPSATTREVFVETMYAKGLVATSPVPSPAPPAVA
jgi:UDP-glucose 4-epimerase